MSFFIVIYHLGVVPQYKNDYFEEQTLNPKFLIIICLLPVF